jgi:hypothetical protein
MWVGKSVYHFDKACFFPTGLPLKMIPMGGGGGGSV